MRQGGVAEGGCERIGDSDEEERENDTAIGEDGRGACAGGGVETEVEVADRGCEEGLDRIEEDREFEKFGRGGRAVGSGC